MRKKVILVLLGVLFLTGCTRIQDLDYLDIVNANIKSYVKSLNQYRTGYKYYLPKGMSIANKKDYNEIATSERYKYYIYVDLVSYYNNVVEEYKVDSKAYFSESFTSGENFGYLEINKNDDKYLVEIMYNYAKIEVIVEEHDIKSAVSNSINVLSSIIYNDNVINNLMGDNFLSFKDMEFNIFETKKDVGSNYLTALEEQDQQMEDALKDPDYVK